MQTKLTLTNSGVVVNMGSKEKTLQDNEFYSPRSNRFKHIDMRDVNEMFPTVKIVIENNKDEMVTLEALDGDKSKLTQISPSETKNFHYDSFA